MQQLGGYLALNDQEFEYLKKKILTLTDIDLNNYKAGQMRRRLDGLVSNESGNVVEYCKRIEHDNDALKKLRNFLTINVSEFFRDASPFQQLKTTVLPELLRNNGSLSIWSAGCSIGAEPYSVAMMLENLTPGQKHRIVATDIDDAVLVKAKNGGPYSSSDIANVDKALLLKYFTRSDNGYQVIDTIKRRVEFKRHDLLKDGFERGFDLVMCRNVVIYFSDEAKRTLYTGFTNSLKEEGVMFIGATETLLDASGFGLERIHNCFYRKPGSKKKTATLAAAARAAKV